MDHNSIGAFVPMLTKAITGLLAKQQLDDIAGDRQYDEKLPLVHNGQVVGETVAKAYYLNDVLVIDGHCHVNGATPVHPTARFRYVRDCQAIPITKPLFIREVLGKLQYWYRELDNRISEVVEHTPKGDDVIQEITVEHLSVDEAAKYNGLTAFVAEEVAEA